MTEKKSLVWVEMVLWGDLTMKYIHPFYHCRDLLPTLRLKTEEISMTLRYFSTRRVKALQYLYFRGYKIRD